MKTIFPASFNFLWVLRLSNIFVQSACSRICNALQNKDSLGFSKSIFITHYNKIYNHGKNALKRKNNHQLLKDRLLEMTYLFSEAADFLWQTITAGAYFPI